MKIGIIGAGVIGSTTAIRLQEQFGSAVSIKIFSEEFSPRTTGDVSAGLWGPYILGDTPQEKILKWSKDTHDYFHRLWINGDAANAGVSLLPVIRITTESKPYDILWRDVVYGCTNLDEKMLERLSNEHERNYKHGIQFNTFTCEPSYLLPYLYKRITEAGGRFERKRIISFDELDSFDLVINCAGLGAQVLSKDDDLKPVRGQVMRVKSPWIKAVMIDDSDDGRYIIANMNTIILGGTHQINDYNRNVSATDRQFIYEGCVKMNASIKRASIVKEMVGLRPGRSQVRLERDNTYTTKSGKQLQIIQNYGHGGSGVTLSYGCAIEVCDIVNEINNAKKVKSKL